MMQEGKKIEISPPDKEIAGKVPEFAEQIFNDVEYFINIFYATKKENKFQKCHKKRVRLKK